MIRLYEPTLAAAGIKEYGIMLTASELQNGQITKFLQKEKPKLSLYVEIHSRDILKREIKAHELPTPMFSIFFVRHDFPLYEFKTLAINQGSEDQFLPVPHAWLPPTELENKGLVTEDDANQFLMLVVEKDQTTVQEMAKELAEKYTNAVSIEYGLTLSNSQARK